MSAADLRIVLLGCPGAGKGTQANSLCERYGLAHLATGDIFRGEVAADTALGREVGAYMKRGALVPDEVVNKVVAAKLDTLRGGWLLDGFPRTLPQARELDRCLEGAGHKIDVVLSLQMRPEELVRRMSGRRSCPACGEVYNVQSRPPKAEGKCDKCGGALVQREDDKEATVRQRLKVYEEMTQPLVAYYRARGALREVDGSRSPDEVAQALLGIVDPIVSSRSGARA